MAITTTTAGWDRSQSQHSSSVPMLDYHLAPSLAPFPHDHAMSSPVPDRQWDLSRASSSTLVPEPSSSSSTINLSRDMALTLRRERELLEAAGPVTYTPATHRISKAKKGKRVHLCQFAGCNKVSCDERMLMVA